MNVDVRADLKEAQRLSWEHIARPGIYWSSEERIAFATAAIDAYTADEPLPPWEGPAENPAVNAAYRIARHAGTLTEDWYHKLLDSDIEPEAYVELVGVVIATIPVIAFAHAAGRPIPDPTTPLPSGPSGTGPDTVQAETNWVRVVPPADEQAAVVQALSAAPAEFENLERLAAAQYIPLEEMRDMDWTRGTLNRRQIELVAARLSALRECFY